jgi:phosphoglucomutase
VVVLSDQEYGRNYYCRYDYEGVDAAAAKSMMASMISNFKAVTGTEVRSHLTQIIISITLTPSWDGHRLGSAARAYPGGGASGADD